MAVNPEYVRSAVELLAGVLLRDVERIAERSAARIQELLPSYARVPRRELTPVVVSNERNLLEAIIDPDADPSRAQVDYRASGDTRARQGITSDEMLHAWRIGLEVVREEARAVAKELEIGDDVLLEFVEATLHWGDVGMRTAASAHHEAEIRELGRLAEEQAALRRVATLVAKGASSGRLFEVVAEQVARVFRVPLVSIVRYEADETATECASVSEHGELFPVGTRWSLNGTNVLAEVRESGRPARINNHTGLKGEIAETVRDAGIRSTVGSPIVVAGELWGAIVVSSTEVQPLPADTESRLMDFSELLAMAISNANARAEVERLADEQAALRRVATLVAQDAPPRELFHAVAREVGTLLGADFSGMIRYEDDATVTTVATWAAVGEHPPIPSRWPTEAGDPTTMIAERGQPARVEDWTAVPGPIAAFIHEELGVSSSVGSPIEVDGRMWGGLAVHSKQRGPLPPDTESRLRNFTELVGTAIANANARAEVERLAEEQAALRRVATMVVRESSPEEIFAKVAEEVGLLLGVEAAAIHRYEPEGDATLVGTWGSMLRVGTRFGLDGNSISSLVYRTQRPARFDDYEHVASTIATEVRKLGIRCAVGSPIMVSGRPWGAITAATSRAEPMPADAESRIAEFTELVATAISNVQARSDLAASRARLVAAGDEERRRVVRDLHDGAQQRLVHTVVTLKLARRALARDRERAAALVGEALQQAQTATDELRELAHGILPSVLAHGGLQAGVRALASRMSIPVAIDVSVDRLPHAVEATAYFVVAEALTNVAKHSNADRATVRARIESGTLQLEVRDDGVGGAHAHGTGLVGLSDRLAALDGSLRVECPADGGTVIAASIPVRERRARPEHQFGR
jgi:signal transduction histidine kinase